VPLQAGQIISVFDMPAFYPTHHPGAIPYMDLTRQILCGGTVLFLAMLYFDDLIAYRVVRGPSISLGWAALRGIGLLVAGVVLLVVE
jgi:hypothetical protein